MSFVGERPSRVNARTWARANYVEEYANRQLRPPEVTLLVRYRDELRGRLLELGCGAGRLTGYLADLARELHGIDLSPLMVEYCRRAVPTATVNEGDLADLTAFEDESFDAVLAGFNVIDVLDDAERRALLDDMHRVIAADGLLIMSSHNRAYIPRLPAATHLRTSDPLRFGLDLLRMPRKVRNQRRLRPLEHEGPDYQMLNDDAHRYSLLHYYISRAAQERQLHEHGFELLECLDLEGRRVEAGETAEGSSELHYIARRVTASR